MERNGHLTYFGKMAICSMKMKMMLIVLPVDKKGNMNMSVPISFSFRGWVSAADVDRVTVTSTMKEIDVTDVDAHDIAEKLNSGEWMLSLGDHLYDNRRAEIEIFDFEAAVD